MPSFAVLLLLFFLVPGRVWGTRKCLGTSAQKNRAGLLDSGWRQQRNVSNFSVKDKDKHYQRDEQQVLRESMLRRSQKKPFVYLPKTSLVFPHIHVSCNSNYPLPDLIPLQRPWKPCWLFRHFRSQLCHHNVTAPRKEKFSHALIWIFQRYLRKLR